MYRLYYSLPIFFHGVRLIIRNSLWSTSHLFLKTQRGISWKLFSFINYLIKSCDFKARKGIVRKAFELPFFYLAFLIFFRLSEKFLLSSSPFWALSKSRSLYRLCGATTSETMFKTPLCNRPSVIYIFSGFLEKKSSVWLIFFHWGFFLSCVFLTKVKWKWQGKRNFSWVETNYSPGTGEAKLSLGKLN